MRYFPESAYWLGADSDVPLFLPEYLESRWIDLHGLTQEIAAKSLPPLEGHVIFSSGHEWGYWLTDYLTARMAWAPALALSEQIDHYSSIFGSCSAEASSILEATIDLERKYLFDGRLAGYLAGEDVSYDLGLIAGFETHPPRVPYERIRTMTSTSLASFERTVVDALVSMSQEASGLSDRMARVCGAASVAAAPWCQEIADGLDVLRLRSLHASSLYSAVLSTVRADGAASKHLDAAVAARQEAAGVIARREKAYRYDLERLTGAGDNPTIYKFGYLRQAHTQCFWTRQEQQARHLITTGEPASPLTDLDTCLK
jgi:hypothetical protein